jgi:hypothetical protein
MRGTGRPAVADIFEVQQHLGSEPAQEQQCHSSNAEQNRRRGQCSDDFESDQVHDVSIGLRRAEIITPAGGWNLPHPSDPGASHGRNDGSLLAAHRRLSNRTVGQAEVRFAGNRRHLQGGQRHTTALLGHPIGARRGRRSRCHIAGDMGHRFIDWRRRSQGRSVFGSACRCVGRRTCLSDVPAVDFPRGLGAGG